MLSAEILPSMLSIKINNSVSKIMAEDKQYCTDRFEWCKEKTSLLSRHRLLSKAKLTYFSTKAYVVGTPQNGLI